MAGKSLQSFSSCSDHQSVMYNVFPWSYKNILIGVGSLNENASVHILLGMYARPQKMNPLHLFLSIICDRSSSEWQMPSFCSHPSQRTSSSHKEHECCKQEQRWERKRKKTKKCTSRTDTCMPEQGRDAWSPLAYIIIQTLNQERIMLYIWVSTN